MFKDSDLVTCRGLTAVGFSELTNINKFVFSMPC